MKCKNCNHTLTKEETTQSGYIHKNIGQIPSFICRVKRCNCLKPEGI